MKRFAITFLIILLGITYAGATHQRAGEITFRHISGLTYEFTILTYTFAPSPADRPELRIEWGDGTSSILPRTEKTDLSNDIRRNVYIGQHTYSGPSTYIVSLEDPNRNYGVINIPNSVNVPLYIETIFTINPFLGGNNSPELLNPPLDNGCVGVPYIHNPGAFDADGDSLSYRFIECKGANGLIIPGYQYPNVSDPNNPPGDLSINPLTGDILWDSPTLQGEYNLAMLIEEWRNGILISSITRDMQIMISSCNNAPPVLDFIPDTCVIAGDTIGFRVRATDPGGDVITLTATGGPLLQNDSPATFEQPVDSAAQVSSFFSWATNCGHIRKQAYQMYFKATDDGYPVELIDLNTVNIFVNGPPPENLTATPLGNSINLFWESPVCTNLYAYKIYRRFGPSGFDPGYCETGVPAYTGYSLIGEINDASLTSFSDDDNGNGLINGINYCYVVTAMYADGAESYVSNEACASLKKDIPVITNVSIEETDPANGKIYLAWSKPTEIDTIIAPGPYQYKIYRSQGFSFSDPVLVETFNDLNDTILIEQELNTRDNIYTYRIEFFNRQEGNTFLIGTTQKASSLRLNITNGDNKLMLDWAAIVPWNNHSFTIYKSNSITSQWDSLTTVNTSKYTDSLLINGQEYCYYILSRGNYSTGGIIDPILNNSQENCGIPLDNEAPCPPELYVSTDCDLIENNLVWTNPNSYCADDVVKYYIYYTPSLDGDFYILDSTLQANDTTYVHSNLPSIAACYAITAIDSAGNQGEFSNVECVSIDSCSIYELPNVFTPNNDGFNDYLRPYPYTSVEKIELNIFNRYGTPVFKTNNPDIEWDGRDQATNAKCSEGVYFYVCEVYEITLEGLRKRTLKGSIHLYR